jgi:hypothetical protein
MSETEMSARDRAKEILVRWMGGENLDTATLEIEQLVHEYVAHATNRGFRNGYEAGEEQFEWSEDLS